MKDVHNADPKDDWEGTSQDQDDYDHDCED